MKKILYSFLGWSLMMGALCSLSSCDDFFDPDTDDELNGEDYISSDTEMYTGFLGIMTKLQSIGDKEILLTDTRAELLEPTEDSNPELISLYNYDNSLQGNSYADPSGYYEVVIACNDYLAKMGNYRNTPGVDDGIWQDLVSSAIRIKVWTYKTIAEIYGQGVWFDDPITKVTDITAANGFTKMELPQLIDKCLELMDNGMYGVTTDRTIDWIAWLDPSNVTNIANSTYRKWNWMVPPYEGIYGELCLWKGACLDSDFAGNTQNPASKAYYEKAADVLLGIINYYVDNYYSSGYWLPTDYTPGRYSSYWNSAQPFQAEVVSALIYDYTKNQTNTLLKHFSNEYPNKYWLRPSETGVGRFLDTDFNPGATTQDYRYKCMFGTNNGQNYISKFRPVGSSVRTNAYQDDVHVYIYRATQYHMLLAEALNHLSRFTAMNGVFNTGVKKEIYVDGAPEWKGFSRNWTSDAEWGTRKYPSAGLRCCYGLSARPVKTNILELGEKGTMKFNDLAILDETMLEFACEGKTYASMNRMAVRYNDPAIVADRVCPKYEATGKSGEIRSKIMSGGNWVAYDLLLGDNQ
ncbi:MAG: hypothetical protein ACI4BA_01750 [Prevotella sp.]